MLLCWIQPHKVKLHTNKNHRWRLGLIQLVNCCDFSAPPWDGLRPERLLVERAALYFPSQSTLKETLRYIQISTDCSWGWKSVLKISFIKWKKWFANLISLIEKYLLVYLGILEISQMLINTVKKLSCAVWCIALIQIWNYSSAM